MTLSLDFALVGTGMLLGACLQAHRVSCGHRSSAASTEITVPPACAPAEPGTQNVDRPVAELPPAADLLIELRAAVRSDSLQLHYQPKLRARTGEIDSVEALVRWPHPDGEIFPDRFIPLAEAHGDIGDLTRWVVHRAIRDRKRLAAAGFDLTIYVNLSAGLLTNRDFARWLTDVIQGGGIGLEVTETAMITDPEGALANLKTFASAGIRVAIDDYGAGFSSLAYLKQVPAQELKLDKMFISGLASSHRDPLLVRSTIDLAHALEMEVTAEGIESPAELALLRIMGCDLMQGFFISRPLPLDALITYLGQKRDERPGTGDGTAGKFTGFGFGTV